MLPEDVEARFRRIEDNLAVTAELQRQAEDRSKEDIDHVKAIQDAMARWMDKMADRQDEFEVKMSALIDAQIQGEAETRELRRMLELYLKSRTNGGGN